MVRIDPLGGERRELRIEVLTQSAHPRVPEDRCHSIYSLIALRQ